MSGAHAFLALRRALSPGDRHHGRSPACVDTYNHCCFVVCRAARCVVSTPTARIGRAGRHECDQQDKDTGLWCYFCAFRTLTARPPVATDAAEQCERDGAEEARAAGTREGDPGERSPLVLSSRRAIFICRSTCARGSLPQRDTASILRNKSTEAFQMSDLLLHHRPIICPSCKTSVQVSTSSTFTLRSPLPHWG